MINMILGARANGLAIARSLADPKNTIAVDFPDKPVCQASRYVEKYIKLETKEERILSTLNDLASGGKAILFPTDDFWIDFLARHSDSLQDRFHFFNNNLKIIQRIIDKYQFYNHCKNTAETPYTQLWDGAANIGKLIKPRLPFSGSQIISKGLNHKYEFESGKDMFVQQDYLDVPLNHHLSLTGIYYAGKIHNPYTTCKLSEYPSPGGTATLICSHSNDNDNQALLEIGYKLLPTLDFEGIFELEFIKTDDRYWVIELNPRFWLQHKLSMAHGINYAVLYKELLTQPNPSLSDSLPKDINKIAYWIHEGIVLDMIRGRNLGTLLSAMGKKCIFAHWQKDDIGPFIAFARQKLKKQSV